MIKKIFTLLLVTSSFVANAQFGIEANYGLNGSYDQATMALLTLELVLVMILTKLLVLN